MYGYAQSSVSSCSLFKACSVRVRELGLGGPLTANNIMTKHQEDKEQTLFNGGCISFRQDDFQQAC